MCGLSPATPGRAIPTGSSWRPKKKNDRRAGARPVALSPGFKIVSFDEVPGWSRDHHAGAYAAFRRSAFHVLSKPYRTGALGVEFSSFADAYADARACESQDAKAFFERHFIPARI